MMIRSTPLPAADTPIADRWDAWQSALLEQDEGLANLTRFLAAERDKSAARLVPCICGHVAMFCACPTLTGEKA